MSCVALLALLAVAQVSGEEPRTVSSGQIRRIAIPVDANQAVVGQVEQGETDLALTVRGPDGGPVGEYDARERSAEAFVFVARQHGPYWLEVRPVAANVRDAVFTVQIVLRPASDEVERRVVAVTLHTSAKKVFAKGDLASVTEALDQLRRLRPLWAGLNEPHWELAAVAKTGDGLYRMGEFVAAKEVYRDALSLSRRLGDLRTQAEVRNNLAMVAWRQGEVADALEWLDEALANWRMLKFSYGEAIAITNRGILLWESGEYDEARQHYARALAIFETIGDVRGEAYAVNNMGVLLEALGENRQALSYLNRAIRLFRRTSDKVAEGRAEVWRARIHLTLGDRQLARASIDRALLLIRLSADQLAEADAISQLGRVLDASSRGVLARSEYHKALALYQGLGSRRGMADAFHDLGASHLASGDAGNAMPFLAQARDLRRALGLRAVEAESLFLMARVERRRDHFELARTHLEAALALVESLRVGVLEKQLRSAYAESKQQYYAAYIDLLVESHRRDPGAGHDRLAFEAAERSRARGLTELLRESWNGVAASLPPALAERERALRKEINYWSWQQWQQAAQPAGTAREALAASNLARLFAEHDQAEADIRRSDRRYSSVLRPETLPLDVIQREVIDADTVLLSFHLGRERSFVWAVTRDAVRVEVLPARAEIERRARRYLALVTTGAAVGTAPLETESAGLAVTRAVLQPVADVLGRRRVMIVADGILHLVPFAALPRAGGSPLLQASDTVVLPSATVLALLRRELAGRPPAPRILAVIADPVFEGNDPRVQAARTSGVRGAAAGRFLRLPYSRDEANRILELVPPALSLKALDFQASRALATSPTIGEYRFVHLATHAVQNDQRPALSGIVFSMVDAKGVAQDGFLRLHDVYNLELRADLVVLSACETGTGKQLGGEGVASLARGLFHAGAARVVSTLWEVDDEATSHLMQLFYKQLLSLSAPSPSSALRLAQAAMRKHPRWRHPYYWAGFVLQGEW